MSIIDFAVEEISLILAIRSEPNKTKANIRKLNDIFNKKTGETYKYCLCDDYQREKFFNFFYLWYDKKAN